MRPPWWKRQPGGPPAIELDPDTFGGRVQAGQRKTIHVTPPRETNPNAPAVTDAERFKVWKGIAESRADKIRDLQDEIDRLRADAALTTNGQRVKEYIDLRKALLRLEDQLDTCRREHIDRDEADRLRDDAARLRAALAQRVIGAVW